MAEISIARETENRKIIEQYLRDVRKAMDWPENEKNENLEKLSANLLENHLDEEDFSMEALCRSAGTPEEVASEFLLDQEPDEIRKKASKSAKIKRIALIAALAIILIVVIAYVAIFTDVARTNRGHFDKDATSDPTSVSSEVIE